MLTSKKAKTASKDKPNIRLAQTNMGIDARMTTYPPTPVLDSCQEEQKDNARKGVHGKLYRQSWQARAS
jgi:hypothetical protein